MVRSTPFGEARPGGLVVTSQQLAADAGGELLAAGGTAVDAAVAAAFALCVVDPSNCGVGGYGGFLVYAPVTGEPVAVEFNTWMPARFDPARLRVPGGVGPMVRGGAGVAPPAVVPGLLTAHERFGRRPRAEVLAPAIRLARDGFPVGTYLAWALSEHLAQGGARRAGEFESIFYPGAAPLAAGALLVQPELAATLELIRELGADALRRGPIATAICETVVVDGGVVEPADLAEDHLTVGPTATATFAGATLYGPSQPGSGTGILYAALAELDPGRLGENRSPEYVAALAAGLRSAWVARRADAEAPATDPHTTHLCAAAPDGDLAAVTFTHGPWFGSDLVAAGTGIVLNGGANLLAPSPSGGYAAANMAPLVLDGPDGTRHVLGATGGPRIPAILLTSVVDVVCFGSTLDDAIAAPHVSVQAADGRLEVERELAEPGGPAPGALTIQPGDFGPAYGITRTAGGYLAGVDARFESGLAVD